MSEHILFVCTTCASKYQDGKKVGESGGEKLMQQMQISAQAWELASEFLIEPVQCLSTCSQACAIAFMGSNKLTYLFGNLPVDETQIEITATTVLECAGQYYENPQGLLSYKERPELLKNKVMARIPAFPAPEHRKL